MPTASPELVLPTPAPDVYKTEGELTESLERKGTAEPGTGLYPRDGRASVSDIEAAISELTIPEQHLNVVVASGMAAVNGAVEFAMITQGREFSRRPHLIHANELYSQSLASFTGLRDMGVAVTGAHTADKSPEDLLSQEPDVIFAETVANTPGMPVFDMHGLLDLIRPLGKQSPIVVLDNTLPLKTGQDFERILGPDDRVIIVESATKSMMHNSDHLGVVYSGNEELIEGFRKYKATKGFGTSSHADEAYLRTIEATAPSYHERNRALFESTGKIAMALAEAQEILAQKTDLGFTVSFPAFNDHPNSQYVVEHFPDGVSPVVFLACQGFDAELARQLLKRISQHPAIQEQIDQGQIFLGQSFGFKEARLLYDRDAPQVRVAGGYDIDSDALADALKEAAADI